MADADVLFEVRTPLGFGSRDPRSVGVDCDHQASRDGGSRVERQGGVESPDEIRQSRTDTEILLFYNAEGASRWVCAVAKHARDQAFLITAYPTDAIKEGIRVWPS
jgi:hypothetical protein